MLWFVRMYDEVVELDEDEERDLELGLEFGFVRFVVRFGSFLGPVSLLAHFVFVTVVAGTLGDPNVGVNWTDSSSVLQCSMAGTTL
jgi:hypothetical protein